MRPIALHALTWTTVAAAVASALWLAAVEPDPGAALRMTAFRPKLLPLAAPGERVAAAREARRHLGADASSRQDPSDR